MVKGKDYQVATEIIGRKFKSRKIKVYQGITYPIGTVFTISRVNMGSPDYFYVEEVPNNGIYFTPSIMDLLALNEENLKELIKDVDKKIDVLNAEKKKYKMQIKFMKDNGLEEYDDEEFKAYSVLQALKESGSDIEKAKIIAGIIKG